MRSMRHNHLLPLYATSVETHYLWIITPFVSGGTLENILHHAFPKGFPEKVVASISRMVLEALAYLHNHGIVHRDIKTSNILLRNDGHIYLGDLGIAAQVVQADTRNPGKMLRLERHTFAGTLQYISPEIVEGIGYDERVDVWSYGVYVVVLLLKAVVFFFSAAKTSEAKPTTPTTQQASLCSNASLVLAPTPINPCTRPSWPS